MKTTISYIIPTRNRQGELTRTLERLGAMGHHDAEVIVVDNASVTRPHVPARLSSGVPVSLITRPGNDGAAARNAGARVAAGQWLVMLDDDSHPTCTADELLGTLDSQPEIVAAVMGDIRLPAQGCREAGGLPEVFIGCGVAIRRGLFLHHGGYDAEFGYYAEEYDLSARLLLDGLRIVFEPAFTVDHHKVTTGRDMDLILHRLIRNNLWVMQRYAPEHARRDELRRTRARYRQIAEKERAIGGFGRGLVEARHTLARQRRTPLSSDQFARFTGLAAARAAIAAEIGERPARTAALVRPGKNEHVVALALRQLGVTVVDARQADEADMHVVATMSPGPMIDAALELTAAFPDRRVVAPWGAARRVLNMARASGPLPARTPPSVS